MEQYNLRIYQFNTYTLMDALADEEESNKKDCNVFMIQIYGIDEQGCTYSVALDGFNPFFYVKVGDKWTKSMKENFINHLKEKMGNYYSNSIISSKLIERYNLYGFDNKKKHKFIFIEFTNMIAFNKAKNLWYTDYQYGYKLLPNGYNYMDTNILIYESNIPPLLRFFHIKQISPSGWITIPKKKTNIIKNDFKLVNCDYELSTNIKNIKPLNEKETRVPYKIMSFDIEASSSHGDFPIPIKTYKKLATNIIEYLEKNKINFEKNSKEIMHDIFKNIILTAFGYSNVEGIDLVYPKKHPETLDKVIELFEKWIKFPVSNLIKTNDYETANKIETAFKNIELNFQKKTINELDEDEDEETEYVESDSESENVSNNNENDYNDFDVFNKYNNSKITENTKEKEHIDKKATIIDILLDNKFNREEKVNELNISLNSIFPKLEGDKVTFIGSTFMKYGDKTPYLNHCIVLNNCKEITNGNIETYQTEKDVLLAWQKLVQKENPDIIIGYNIFGFDYEFMFRRSEENNCVTEFLKLSKNKNEICGNFDRNTGKWNITESSIQLASGQHDLRYIKMNGRLQIDLYNFYRRTENLTSYKLDYVAGNFIGDYVKDIEHNFNYSTIKTSNLTGLCIGSYIHIEEIGHTTDYYNNGEKYLVIKIDNENMSFIIDKIINPDKSKKIRWCMAKDDVTPKDIFRMTNGTDEDRSTIAKYCIQDCNLVHYLFNKSDILTGFIEMSKICSVPIEFLVMRGQGIKLQSLIAKECRENRTLIPVLQKYESDDGYEGAIVLQPKCNIYLDVPVACNDYESLYPSLMMSENLSHDSKVWTKEFDLNGNLIKEWGYKDDNGKFMYDNLPGYEYVNISYDTYKYVRKHKNAKAEKQKCGIKICRFIQFNDEYSIMPSILQKLLKARKDTRKLIPNEKDEFMKQVLEQRQLGYKATANSLYGCCAAKTSSFYEKDIASCTTAMGRKLLTYGKRIIEECYKNRICQTKNHGQVITNAEYIYGDTDSVFYTFNLTTLAGEKIKGKLALEISIELAQEVGELSAKFLKSPHNFEYEKTFMPFCLLSKKRYVGMLYETDINKCKRKEMGIVLKRRDNAPIVKDVYGGIIDILMKNQNIPDALQYLKNCLDNLVNKKYPIDKLIITKSLRSGYKKPNQIAHKVLADKIAMRDPGNKISSGDRIPFVYIVVPSKKKEKILQGNKIETPSFVIEKNLKIDYSFYISNQIMKPIQQLFALVLEEILTIQNKKKDILIYKKNLEKLKKDYDEEDIFNKKLEKFRCKEIEKLLFKEYLIKTNSELTGNQMITNFFKM